MVLGGHQSKSSNTFVNKSPVQNHQSNESENVIIDVDAIVSPTKPSPIQKTTITRKNNENRESSVNLINSSNKNQMKLVNISRYSMQPTVQLKRIDHILNASKHQMKIVDKPKKSLSAITSTPKYIPAGGKKCIDKPEKQLLYDFTKLSGNSRKFPFVTSTPKIIQANSTKSLPLSSSSNVSSPINPKLVGLTIDSLSPTPETPKNTKFVYLTKVKKSEYKANAKNFTANKSDESSVSTLSTGSMPNSNKTVNSTESEKSTKILAKIDKNKNSTKPLISERNVTYTPIDKHLVDPLALDKRDNGMEKSIISSTKILPNSDKNKNVPISLSSEKNVALKPIAKHLVDTVARVQRMNGIQINVTSSTKTLSKIEKNEKLPISLSTEHNVTLTPIKRFNGIEKNIISSTKTLPNIEKNQKLSLSSEKCVTLTPKQLVVPLAGVNPMNGIDKNIILSKHSSSILDTKLPSPKLPVKTNTAPLSNAVKPIYKSISKTFTSIPPEDFSEFQYKNQPKNIQTLTSTEKPINSILNTIKNENVSLASEKMIKLTPIAKHLIKSSAPIKRINDVIVNAAPVIAADKSSNNNPMKRKLNEFLPNFSSDTISEHCSKCGDKLENVDQFIKRLTGFTGNIHLQLTCNKCVKLKKLKQQINALTFGDASKNDIFTKIPSNDHNYITASIIKENKYKTDLFIEKCSSYALKKCSECNETFLNLDDLEVHNGIVHCNDKHSTDCDFCDAKFSNKNFLRLHVLKNHVQKFTDRINRLCAFCCMEFETDIEHNQHEEHTHIHLTNGIKMYKCDYKFCSFIDEDRLNMIRHIDNIHKSHFNCMHCDFRRKKFYNYKDWILHIITKHWRKRYDNNNAYLCCLCGEKFRNCLLLNEHENLNHIDPSTNLYKCMVNDCQHRNKCKQNAFEHFKRDHPDVILPIPFTIICEICGDGFFKLYQLNKHVNLKHTIASTYVCDICACEIKYKSGLKRHMVLHTNDRPYKCNICPKTYRDMTDLRRHKRIHGFGEKNVCCTLCDQRFYEPKNLRNHMSVRHSIVKFQNKKE